MDPFLVDRVLDMAVNIQQIPAPTFAEGRRAAYLRTRFKEERLADVAIDEIGNVYARLPGRGLRPPVVVSAHTDTVFPENTNLQVGRGAEKISGPGIGDNSLGVAGLFGLLWALRRVDSPLAGDVWLVANIGEEGLGDLGGMRAVVKRFAGQPQAYIILEGMALGQVYHRGLGVRRYRIAVETAGGHSWVDFGKPSAVHELSVQITRLLALPLPDQPRTTMNVGVIEGGISVNTIAPRAYLELDLRSESRDVLSKLAVQVEAMVEGSNRPEVRITVEVIGDRPVGEIPPGHPLVNLALRSLEAVGIQPTLNVGSTDANVPLSVGLPAICVGLTFGDGAHTTKEYIYTHPLLQGLQQLVAIVRGLNR